MQWWEYAVVELHEIKDKEMVALLNRQGATGWELVGVVASIDTDALLAFFKKRFEAL